jgi:hypothetical protein
MEKLKTNFMSKFTRLIVALPLLLAIQCFEDDMPSFEFNEYTVQISPFSALTFKDTLWIEGRVSSQVYDLVARDSVFAESPLADVFSVYQFIEPTDLVNCRDAFDKFTLIFVAGEYSFLPTCENATVQATPVLADSELHYTYRIGLIPKLAGDFVVSLQSGRLQNKNRNEFIIDAYPIPNKPNQIGFNSCNSVSWRFLDESDREYYFSVTE